MKNYHIKTITQCHLTLMSEKWIDFRCPVLNADGRIPLPAVVYLSLMVLARRVTRCWRVVRQPAPIFGHKTDSKREPWTSWLFNTHTREHTYTILYTLTHCFGDIALNCDNSIEFTTYVWNALLRTIFTEIWLRLTLIIDEIGQQKFSTLFRYINTASILVRTWIEVKWSWLEIRRIA